MSNPWFRMYTDFLNDPKMISLAFEDQRHFIGVLALKSDGALDQQCDEKLLDRIVAQRLWVDYAIISDVKRRLIGAGLIDESWQPLAWDKRQFKSDKDSTAAARQQRYRDSQSRNALRNGTVTRLDTDTDTEQKQIKTKAKRTSGADVFPEVEDRKLVADWLKVRKEKRLALTETALNGFMREVRKSGLSLETILKKCCEKGWGGFEAKWLESDYGQPKRAEKFDPLAFVNKYSTQGRDEKLIN